MTLRPDVDALIHGALDDTLTPEERERLDRLMTESVEARGRAAHLRELTDLLDSLGPAEPPATLVDDVLAQLSDSTQHPPASVRRAGVRAGTAPRVAAFPITRNRFAPKKGIALNTKIMLGLAAAAVLVLGVLTFMGSPPATGGTEATIGGAQRAQSSRIETKDAARGGTGAQAVMQTETWDQLVKDDTLRTLLQDANFLARLQDAELQRALSDENIVQALRDPAFGQKLQDQTLVRSLTDAETLGKLDDANLRAALTNRAFVDALRNTEFRAQLAKADSAAALARPAFQDALKDRGFARAIRDSRFAEAMTHPSTCPNWSCAPNPAIGDGAPSH